jgi:anti-sigma B factor antagonist
MNRHGLEITRQGDVVIARLDGEIDLANTPTVSAAVLEAVPNDAVGLVIDLSGVRYIDSVAIRMLFNFVRSLHESRQGMAIAIPPDSPVRRLLKITHLDEATEFRDSIDEAVIALRETGTPQY